MEDDTDVIEDEDMADTTERIGDEDVEDEEVGEVDEEGEVDDDEEDSEDEDDEEESEDDEEDEDDVSHREQDVRGCLLTLTQEIDVTGVNLVAGDGISGIVKTEPGEATAPGEAGAVAEGEVINTLVPKKKSRKKREASVDDLPAAPPPMITIRLEYKLQPEGQECEWNVLEAAQDAGLIPRWPTNEEEKVLEPIETSEATPTAGGPDLALGFEGDAEEIARRFAEKYDKPTKKRPAKKKVSYRNRSQVWS